MTNAVKLFRYLINRKRSTSSGSVTLPSNNSCRWLPRTTYASRNFEEGISFTAVSNVREIDPYIPTVLQSKHTQSSVMK